MRIKFIFYLLLMFGCLNISAQKQCSTKLSEDRISEVSLISLSKEFKRMRKLKCDDFRSGMWVIMDELRKRMDNKSKEQIRKVMGKPDKIEGSHWIYSWRHFRDYLAFDFSEDSTKAFWYNAYE